MGKVVVTGKANTATKVQIYEPRQSADQEEVILEEFELKPLEQRELEYRSNTIAYRHIDIPTPDMPPQPEIPDQEPGPDGVPPETNEEMQAGKERLSQIESSQKAMTAKRGAVSGEGSISLASRAAGATPERATEKTTGQESDKAENPSTSGGSTGTADASKELSPQVDEKAVEANKATDAATPPTQTAETTFPVEPAKRGPGRPKGSTSR